MAYEDPGKCISLPAAADLSTKQYYLITVDAAGRAAVCGDNGNAIGVLQNNPDAIDKPATIMTSGISKLIGGVALPPGTIVASGAAGKGKVAAALGPTIGTMIEDPLVDGQTGTILVQKGHFAAS